MKTVVLLIDSDLGLLFWLGRTLDQAGFEAFPAKDIPAAAELVGELQLPVALVILNLSLFPEAELLLADLRSRYRSLRVLALVDGDIPADAPAGVDALCPLPEVNNEYARTACVDMVFRLLPYRSSGMMGS